MRPPLCIYLRGCDPCIYRGDKIIISLSGGTPAEIESLKAVLLALNALDLSGPKARRAIVAVAKTWPGWMSLRKPKHVEAMSR